MESAYFYNVFFASVDTLRLPTVPSVDTLTECEWLPTDVLIVIGQFIDVKTMEERIRLNKLTEKWKQINTRSNKKWTDVAIHFPSHFGMIHVKVCSKIIKVIKNDFKTKHFKNETFGHECYFLANGKYHKLRRNIVYSNLSRFNPKYQGQKHVSIDGNTFVALPQKYWHEWHYGIQGCAPLHW